MLEQYAMTMTSTPAKSWTKPEFTRLGRIADVAGGQPVPKENKNNS